MTPRPVARLTGMVDSRREYGIPAVVGTGAATATIMDGQLVEVDGDAGMVRLI